MLPHERKLEIVVEKTGSKDVAARYVEKQMMTGTIDIAYGRRIQAAWWREPQSRADGPTSPARPPEIVRMDTYAGLQEVVTGIVRDLVAERDVYRLFGFPRTAGVAALLGELGEGRFAQITVHDTALCEPDIGSYTFLVRTRQIATFDIRRGDLVRCALQGVGVLDHEPV